ncbi:thioesterase domain-containing protein [Allosalinactinospora lopnorensis]|uniref:thioesterase domain-containing protein n=1 Tax=Allosalinactinospora lopnorensis TaxID=1352348 RepID=UPI000696C20B|nr:thioesterase domain-containing protein [Allosalinactinospora lopnorensis]
MRTGAARVLGRPAAEDIGTDQTFLELGFSSLTALELRNELNTVTGLRLPAAAAFSHPTPAELARHLDGELQERLRTEPGEPEIADTSPDEAADGVVELFRRSCRTGRIGEGIELIQAASRFRPTFTDAAGFGAPPRPVRLSEGPARPHLICLPSLVMLSGVQEYARFAAGLRDLREVQVIPQPGFTPGEPLPASIEAVVDVQVRALCACAAGEPFVLVGRSSGGWVAHAVTERLEEAGVGPEVLVLVDTPLPEDQAVLPVLGAGMLERERQFGSMDLDGVNAMGAYLRLFAEWSPKPVSAPSLMILPDEPVRDHTGLLPGGDDWRFTWDLPHLTLEVTGDHLTMMEEHAESTALALHTWLEQR